MNPHANQSRRRGSIVHEAALAVLLAGLILTSVVQFLAVSAQQARLQQQRVTATREAGNLMEQLMAHSWQQLTPEFAETLKLSESCQATLPNVQLAVEIADTDTVDTDTVDTDDTASEQNNADGAKRLRIQITWRHDAGLQEAPVHLVAWKYRRETTP